MTAEDSGATSAKDGYQVRKRTKFPPICVKCGTRDALIARRRTLTYIPPSIYVAFCFGCGGMILGAVLCLATRKTMEFTIPTCSSCDATWDRAARATIIFLVGSLLTTLLVSGLVWWMGDYPLWLPLGVGVVTSSVGSIALNARGRRGRVWAKQMDDVNATLMGIHPTVIAELPG